jgi:preprotein translocase subunit SecG
MAVLLVIHILIALALIVTVLLQRSEGGGLGIGSSGGMGGFMTARGTGNLLTKITAGLATAFMVMSLLLGWLAGSPAKDRQRSIFDSAPAQTAPAVPATPAAPAAPLAR